MATWNKIADVFEETLKLYPSEWKCRVPDHTQAFSASDEPACDEWCKRIAQQLAEPIFPPKHVQPMILARMATATACLRRLQLTDSSHPEKLTPQLIEHFLIHHWREQLRDHWIRFGGSQSFSA
jgi:hypothetical protein